jgi:hypothetical protein
MEDEFRERPVDRLHAMACAQTATVNRAVRESHLAGLGVSLIALRDSNRPDEYARAVDRLAKFLHGMVPRANPEMRKLLATQAIHENVISFCPRCKGTGEIPAQDGLDGAQRMAPCPSDTGCGGSGKRRYSDAERMEAMSVNKETVNKVNAQLSYAHLVLAQAESEAVRNAIRLLERW